MPVKFTAEFVERRLAEHRRMMHKLEHDAIEEIIDEVQSLPRRAPRASGQLFSGFNESSSNESSHVSQEEARYGSRCHSLSAAAAR
jgi:hypothetical protein